MQRLSDSLVKWDELVDTFCTRFPRTIFDVVNAATPASATVSYMGQTFEIRPILHTHLQGERAFTEVIGVEVWGPPYVNNFQDSHAVPLPL